MRLPDRALPVACLLLLTSGCFGVAPRRCDEGCGRNAVCDVSTGYCVMTPAARGTYEVEPDAGAPDAGLPAPVEVDAGLAGLAPDAGLDAGSSEIDAGPVAGAVDGGAPEPIDAGALDAGAPPVVDAGPPPCVCAPGFSCAIGTATCQSAFSAVTWNLDTPAMASLSRASEISVSASLVPVPGLIPTAAPGALSLRMSVNGSAFTQASLEAVGALEFARSFAPAGEGHWRIEATFNGLSTGLREFTLDRTPPTLSVAVQPLPARPANWPEPSKWRRDEVVVVLLGADEAIHPEGWEVGFDGAGLPWSAVLPLSACAAAGVPCAVDASRCACVQVDLAQRPMPSLSRTIALQVAAIDLAGNVATPDPLASLEVTRVRFVRPGFAGTVARAAPALDAAGTLYTTQSSAQVSAITPSGADRAGFAVPVGFGNSHSITVDNANNRLYFTESRPSSFSGAPTGILKASFLSNGLSLGSIVVGRELNVAVPLIAPDGLAGSVRAVAVGNDLSAGTVTVSAWAPGASRVDATASQSVPTVTVGVEAPLAAAVWGSKTYLPMGFNLYAWNFNSISWSTTGTPHNAPSTGLALGGDVQSLGVTHRATDAVYGTSGGSMPLLTPSLTPKPSAPVFSAARTMVVALREATRSSLKAFNLATWPVQVAELASWTPAEEVAGAPVLGEGGFTYLATANGRLIVAQGETVWTAALPGTGPVFASPNLDCNRLQPQPGRPGALYVMRGDGTVVSVLVDSPKLEPSAPWPRFQKDAANSGNASMSLFPLNPGCP